MLSTKLNNSEHTVIRDKVALENFKRGLISFEALKRQLEINNDTILTVEDVEKLIKLGYKRKYIDR